MKGHEIAAFAKSHSLRRISVADLIAYRQAREKLVERIATFPVQTEWGPFTGYAYRRPSMPCSTSPSSSAAIGDGAGIPVRLHRDKSSPTSSRAASP